MYLDLPTVRDACHRTTLFFQTTLEGTGVARLQFIQGNFIMAYVITDSCIKDLLCVDVCPTDCIHPKKDEPGFEAATQLYVDPEGCIDCGACVPVCTSDSLHPIDELPEDKKEFAARNAAFFAH
jgi:ferredoxin